jgi:hypothetical protein
MVSLLQKYRDRMAHTHGWEVPLTCRGCGHHGLVKYRGYQPSMTINWGKRPTVYALVACDRCGNDLREAAGQALVALFSEVEIQKGNGRLVFLCLLGVAALLGLVVVGSSHVGPAMFGFFGLLGPLIMLFNYKVAGLRYRCGCAEPAPKFMGLLGRSYCYRCSNCEKLVRLRD